MSDIIFNEKNEVIDLKNKNKADFKSLAKNNQLSEKFILENADFLDWNIISENQKITIKTMLQCAKKIKWAKIPQNLHLNADMQLIAKYKADFVKLADKEKSNITEAFIRENYAYFPLNEDTNLNYLWSLLSKNVLLSEEFVRDFRFLLHFDSIKSKQKHLSPLFLAEFNHYGNIERFYYHSVVCEEFKDLSQEEILENADRMNWVGLMMSKTFSEDFITKIIETKTTNVLENPKFWYALSVFQPLSDAFIAKFEDKINFQAITSYYSKYPLSEKQMRKYADKNLYWSYISEHCSLSATFIEDFKHKIVWERLSCNETQCLTEEIILKYKDKWYADWIWYCQKLSEPFIRKVIEEKTFKVNWEYLWECQTPVLSVKFFQDFEDKIVWYKINYSKRGNKIYGKQDYSYLGDDFVKTFPEKILWYFLCAYSPVSEPVLRKHKDKLNWNVLFVNQFERLSPAFKTEFVNAVSWNTKEMYKEMSEKCAQHFEDKVNWNYVYEMKENDFSEEFIRKNPPINKEGWVNLVKNQKMSEAFLIDFADKIDLKLASKTQNLSENFMRTFEKKLDWKAIFKTQKISAKFIQEFKSKI